MKHSESAVKLFKSGYNCSQSVFAAFSDITGLEKEYALKISSGFGGGMGRMREVCGTVSGMCMVISMLFGSYPPENTSAKSRLYSMVQEVSEEFHRRNGSIICRELLGLPAGNDSPVSPERTPEFYRRRPCAEYVQIAADILDEFIERNNIK